jgi:hypothetical protein
MLTMLNKRPGEDFRLEFFASPDPPFIWTTIAALFFCYPQIHPGK